MMFSQQLNTNRIFKRVAKALIRLCACTGWSEALLVAHTTLLEISCHSLYVESYRVLNIKRSWFPVYLMCKCCDTCKESYRVLNIKRSWFPVYLMCECCDTCKESYRVLNIKRSWFPVYLMCECCDTCKATQGILPSIEYQEESVPRLSDV